MKSDEYYQAIVDNFEDYAEKIADLETEMETGTDTAESLSKSNYPDIYTGFGHFISIELQGWQQRYDNNVIGAAIEEIESEFPELSDPRMYYWTTNIDIQGEIANFVNRYVAAFEAAAAKIQENLDRIKREQEEEAERKREEAENLKRAQDQAKKARETEMKYKDSVADTFASGLKGGRSIGSFFKGIGKALSGLFKR